MQKNISPAAVQSSQDTISNVQQIDIDIPSDHMWHNSRSICLHVSEPRKVRNLIRRLTPLHIEDHQRRNMCRRLQESRASEMHSRTSGLQSDWEVSEGHDRRDQPAGAGAKRPMRHFSSSISAFTHAWYLLNSALESLPAPFIIQSSPPG